MARGIEGASNGGEEQPERTIDIALQEGADDGVEEGFSLGDIVMPTDAPNVKVIDTQNMTTNRQFRSMLFLAYVTAQIDIENIDPFLLEMAREVVFNLQQQEIAPHEIENAILTRSMQNPRPEFYAAVARIPGLFFHGDAGIFSVADDFRCSLMRGS